MADVIKFDWLQTVISQYGNSPRILGVIESFADCMDQSVNIDAFYNKMWNIDTAEGYGLDVWGRILGVGRALAVDAGDYFGFEEPSDVSEVGWGQEPWYAGPPTTNNYLLTDDAYRVLLLAKAAANICDGGIQAINRLLMNLFPGRGNAYVLDGAIDPQDFFGFTEEGVVAFGWNQEAFYNGQQFIQMNMRYVFEFSLTPVELAIVTQSGVLPTPTGVKSSIEVIP